MEIIGRMIDGKFLAFVMPEEVAAWEMLVQAVAGTVPTPKSESKPAAKPKTPKTPKTPKPTTKSVASRAIKCKQCGQTFERQVGSKRQCCSPECHTTYNREYQRKWWQRKHEKRDRQEHPAPTSGESIKDQQMNLIKAAVLGTDKKINWTHQFATAWNDIDAGTEAPEDEVIRKLWAQVQPVLLSRLRYQTIVGCEPQYIEALAQAKSLLGISENDLKQWTKEAPEKPGNKKSKRSK